MKRRIKNFFFGPITSGWHWFFKNSLIAGLVGTIVLLILYYNILDARRALEGGYFSSPALTAATEFTWFLMAAFIYLAAAGIKRWATKRRRKR